MDHAFANQQGATKLSFERLDGADCKLIVDFIGSLVESAVDVESLVQELSQCKDEQALIQASKTRFEAIQHELFQRSMEFRDGWFGQHAARFCSVRFHETVLDHTSFNHANTSEVLSGALIFLDCFSWTEYTIDIFQSDAPNFPAVFWLLPLVPKTAWFDVEPKLPVSPLSFKRSASVRHDNKSKTFKSQLTSSQRVGV